MKSKVAYQVPWFVVLRGEREVDDDVEVGLTLGQDLQGPIVNFIIHMLWHLLPKVRQFLHFEKQLFSDVKWSSFYRLVAHAKEGKIETMGH